MPHHGGGIQHDEQDDPEAQFGLAVLYAKGQGVPQEYGKAAKWIYRSATLGNALSQAMMSVLYRDGLWGFPQDLGKAVIRRESFSIHYRGSAFFPSVVCGGRLRRRNAGGPERRR